MANLEYTRFGDTILQRPEGSTEDWKEVPKDDRKIAEKALQDEAEQRAENIRAFNTPHSTIKITRADGTVEEQ